MHPTSTITRTIAAGIFAALIALCFADLAAAMPMAGPADCAVCDERTGCTSTTAASPALPVAILTGVALVATPIARAILPMPGEPPAAPDRQISPRAPRAPPLA